MNTCVGFAAMKQDTPWDVGGELQKYNSSLRQKISLIQVQKMLNHEFDELKCPTPEQCLWQTLNGGPDQQVDWAIFSELFLGLTAGSCRCRPDENCVDCDRAYPTLLIKTAKNVDLKMKMT